MVPVGVVIAVRREVAIVTGDASVNSDTTV
jgi:hypothetical protein